MTVTERDDLSQQLATDLDGSFERLVLVYQERIFRFALRLLGNPEDAEEIAQDTFVRAYHALAGYERRRIEQLALRSWLYAITLNLVRNRRRGKRLTQVSLDGPANGMVPLDIMATDHDHQPVARAEAMETGAMLAAAIVRLPLRYRAAVVLRLIEDLPYQEISRTLNQPVGTIKANVHRGRELLQQDLTRTVSFETSLSTTTTSPERQ